MRRVIVFGLIALMLGMMGANENGCTPSESADQTQKVETEQMVREAHQKIGMPNILNFTERRFVKYLFELRDEELTTYSYFMDMNGNLHFLCESIGYGIPYSVQYTNPEKRITSSWGNVTLPQPDPNGLFMPQGLSATFVLCSDGEGGVRPVYSEPNLIVSPMPLEAASGYLKGGK